MAEPVLSFFDRVPPFAAVAAAKLAGVTIKVEADPKATNKTPTKLKFASGDELVGELSILRYIARAAKADALLYGADPLQACQVDDWLQRAVELLVNGPGLGPAAQAVDDYLALRTFLVGSKLSIADLLAWGQLKNALQFGKMRKSGGYVHVGRWLDFLSAMPEMKAATEELDWKAKANKAKEARIGKEAMAKAGDTGSFDINLPDAIVGKVVTRFPPEPSGYLHIGHAKAALLNQYFKDMYKGKMIIRFDDTNPSKEKDEYVENIVADMKTLQLSSDRLTYTSDYFPQMLDLAVKLINAGLMYADDTPQEQMRDERMHGVESKHRNRPAAESLAIWEEMKNGTEIGLANCMRFKINMQDLNKAMRDPVAYRCNLEHHWRTGHSYKVYPTYDCACPFVDSLEGVTHALRTTEYKDREAQYYWVLEAQMKVWPGLKKVHLWDFARLNFVYTVMSKRKLLWFVETGRVEGWTDPRFPTLQGIMRRGLTLEALKEFIISQGASRNVTTQEWDKIWTMNKRIIDPVAPRHTAVVTAGKVPVTLANGPAKPEIHMIPKHRKNADLGNKAMTCTSVVYIDAEDAAAVDEGEEITLKDWGNAIFKTFTRDANGAVTAIGAELHLEGDFKKTRHKLTWLPESDELVPLELVDYGYLITKAKVEEDDVFEDLVAENTKTVTVAEGDANMRCLQKGDVIQLERKGYYRVDEAITKPGKPLVLFCIPDGKQVKPATGPPAKK